MSNYEKYKRRYDRGGARKDQIKRLTQLGALSPKEYESIVGEAYEG